MQSLRISITISPVGAPWTASWKAETGTDPHRCVTMAKLIAGVAGAAAAGDWQGEQVNVVLAQIGRDHADLPAPNVTWRAPAPADADPDEELEDERVFGSDPESESTLNKETV